MAEQTGQSWECLVCGFVHRGPAPPASCPVAVPLSQLKPAGETNGEPERPSTTGITGSAWAMNSEAARLPERG